MASLDNIIAELKSRHALLATTIANLEQYAKTELVDFKNSATSWICERCGGPGSDILGRCNLCGKSKRGRKRMSDTERKEVSRRMAAYWASRRKK